MESSIERKRLDMNQQRIFHWKIEGSTDGETS